MKTQLAYGFNVYAAKCNKLISFTFGGDCRYFTCLTDKKAALHLIWNILRAVLKG